MSEATERIAFDLRTQSCDLVAVKRNDLVELLTEIGRLQELAAVGVTSVVTPSKQGSESDSGPRNVTLNLTLRLG
jgi:hypothetical protein